MVYSALLGWQINLVLSVQIIFNGLQNLKRILKELGLCANHYIQLMGSCLLSLGVDVVDGGVLVEVGETVLLLGGKVEVD